MLTIFAPCAFPKDSKVFIYHISDAPVQKQETSSVQPQKKDIVSDDVTADTSGECDIEDDAEDLSLEDEYEDEVNYNMSDMYTDVLQGYAKYNEEDEQSIFLDSSAKDYFKLSNDSPNYAKSKSLFDYQKDTNRHFQYIPLTKYNTEEYSIKEISGSASEKFGGFSTGTSFNQSLSSGDIEQTSKIFSKYEYKRFAISTSFAKTINALNSNYTDKFYVSPELKINDYFTLKENLSTDFVRKKNKAEVVLSINPFGKRDNDRLKFDFGASRTYNQSDDTFRSQVQFMTKFKF